MGTKRAEFKPWAGDFKHGWLFLLVGLALLWLAWRNNAMPIGIGGVAVAWYGQFRLRRGYYRRRGKRIETAALREKDLPSGWLFKASRRVHTGGDIDFYLESPNGKEKFAIEHKTFESIVVRSTWFGLGEPKFELANGKPLRGDPVGQTMRNAAAVGATPVLWLSRGSAKTIKLRSGLIIVQGGRGKLRRAIGATWFLFF